MDQLKTAMATGLLHGFEEPELRFPPTYKYTIVTTQENVSRKTKEGLQTMTAREYDDKVKVAKTSQHAGVRKPAWTDRILFRPLPETLIKNTRCAHFFSLWGVPRWGYELSGCHDSTSNHCSGMTATIRSAPPPTRQSTEPSW